MVILSYPDQKNEISRI